VILTSLFSLDPVPVTGCADASVTLTAIACACMQQSGALLEW
jgi:hypothetical protein